ncbi:MAG: hypothetical protein LBS69_11210 [Prevotellaceae bacterium]|jgi:hypothetical protein|nr:hypothetical protein [Prevotellaceae bacterium]
MYSEKLEKLINIALADGVLTEKKKQILFKNAEAEGIDLDEFEMVLDARVHRLEQSTFPKENSTRQNALNTLLQLFAKAEQDEKEKLEKEVEVLLKKYNKSANIKETAEFVATVVSTVLSATTLGLSSVALGLIKNYIGKDEESKIKKKIEELTCNTRERINTKKRDIISTFPIPTDKDDILELLGYIYPKIKEDLLKKTIDQKIWEEKFRTIIVRAKINFPNDKIVLAEISKYEEQEKNQQKKRIGLYALIAVIGIALTIYVVQVAIPGVQKKTEARREAIRIEEARLEQILETVNTAIKNNNLDEAEVLTNQLIWKHESSAEKKAWDKQRKELIKTISKIKEDPKEKKGIFKRIKDGIKDVID